MAIAIGSEGYIGGSLKDREDNQVQVRESDMSYRIPGRLQYVNADNVQELYDLLTMLGYKDRYNR